MTTPFTAETLYIAAQNEKDEYDRIVFAVGHLRATLDRTARRVAKENADWHDDAEAEDHADFHAPPSEQFPQSVRDEAIRDLVAFYLGELSIQECD